MKLYQKHIDKLLRLKEGNSNKNVLLDLDSKYFLDGGNVITKAMKTNILLLLDNNVCTVADVAETYSRIKTRGYKKQGYSLSVFLSETGLIEEFFKNHLMSFSDIRTILKLISTDAELSWFVHNRQLAKYALTELAFDVTILKKFSSLMRNSNFFSSNIRNIFDAIEEESRFYRRKDENELLEYNALNKEFFILNSFQFTENEMTEITSLAQNSLSAKTTLFQILETNVASLYSFEQLRRMINKNDEKMKFRLNL